MFAFEISLSACIAKLWWLPVKTLPQTGWADKTNDQTGMSCHPTTVTTGLICLGKSAQPHSQDPSEEVESIESDWKKEKQIERSELIWIIFKCGQQGQNNVFLFDSWSWHFFWHLQLLMLNSHILSFARGCSIMQCFNWSKINQIKHNFDIILHISPINKILILNNLHFIHYIYT